MTKLKNMAESVTPTAAVIERPERNASVGMNQKLKELIEEETKLVRGRFRCFETPGGSLRGQVRKYKDVPMFDKTMLDGETYEVPLYVARHLNGIDKVAGALNGKIGSCSYPVHGFKHAKGDILPASELGVGPNSEGGIPVPIVGITKRVRRFGFESLEFDSGAL